MSRSENFGKLNTAKALHDRYVQSPPASPIISQPYLLEYVFMKDDGTGMTSETRVYKGRVNRPEDVPVTTFSQVNKVANSAKPVVLYHDPFRHSPHYLVLCERYLGDGRTMDYNFRRGCLHTFSNSRVQLAEVQVGITQEYFILDSNHKPIGSGQEGSAQARHLFDAHISACVYAGAAVTGGTLNDGKVQFQIGPTTPVQACDDLWVARYILLRLSSEFGLNISFDDPENEGVTDGTNIHFSVGGMRHRGGIRLIREIIPALKETHPSFVLLCDGARAPSLAEAEFTSSEGKAPASIRIPQDVVKECQGYLEDRRPSSNMDPYLVVDTLLKIIVLRQTEIDNPYLYLSLHPAGTSEEEAEGGRVPEGGHDQSPDHAPEQAHHQTEAQKFLADVDQAVDSLKDEIEGFTKTAVEADPTDGGEGSSDGQAQNSENAGQADAPVANGKAGSKKIKKRHSWLSKIRKSKKEKKEKKEKKAKKENKENKENVENVENVGDDEHEA